MTGKAKPNKMKILLPVDASSCSAEAVQEVIHRPWPVGTTVRVLSAVENIGVAPVGPLMYDASGSLDQFHEQRTNEANELTDRTAGELAKSGLQIEKVVREGDPSSVIVEEAKDWNADLIVMGSHGYTGIKKLVLGSVAQSVVSHAPCSVEVVRRRAA